MGPQIKKLWRNSMYFLLSPRILHFLYPRYRGSVFGLHIGVFMQQTLKLVTTFELLDLELWYYKCGYFVGRDLQISLTQYKRTGHWQKYKVMLSRLYFSVISKYYSQKKMILNIHEIIRDHKRLLPVCKADILWATVKRIEVFSSFYVDFWRLSAKSAENS